MAFSIILISFVCGNRGLSLNCTNNGYMQKKIGLQEIFIGWLKRWFFITTKTAFTFYYQIISNLSKVNTVCNGWHRSVRVFYWLCCTDSQLHKENVKIHNSTILQQGKRNKIWDSHCMKSYWNYGRMILLLVFSYDVFVTFIPYVSLCVKATIPIPRQNVIYMYL